jgi:hypothetical protein
MNNHQNAIFHQLDNFIKHSHSFAMTVFHTINNSAKLVTLLIIPTYAKVSVFYKIVKLVKNGVLMIIHIYAKVSQYNSLKRLLWRLGVNRLNKLVTLLIIPTYAKVSN